MKGKILGFNQESSVGVISGEDENRYNLSIEEWKGAGTPKVGDRIDFLVRGEDAVEVYLELPATGATSKKDGQVSGLNKLRQGRA